MKSEQTFGAMSYTNIQHTAYNIQHTTYKIQHTTHNKRLEQ